MKKKPKLFSIFFGIILAFTILININFGYYQAREHENLKDKIEYKLKSAGYLEVVPIVINSNLDWDIINSTYEWCSGSGTVNDPFVIQKISIDGKHSGNCITITNSDVYFIIKNCFVYNSTIGISLDNVKNGKLIEDINSYNNDRGIRLIHCYNITIIGNRVENNRLGIFLELSNVNNTISKNVIINNNQTGIWLLKSNENIIAENEVCENNLFGIFLIYSNYSRIRANKVYKNEAGINIGNSKYNIISDNLIYDNLNFGAFLKGSNNLLYRNCFKKNQWNADDSGLNNKWDNETIGNYWDDYTGRDANEDGIGDTPYYFQVDSKDNFPLMECPFKEEEPEEEPAIPGYNPFLQLCILSVVAIIISKKLIKIIKTMGNKW